MTIVTTSNWKYIFILVSIHKSCIVYFEKKYTVPIAHGNSFFWSWKSHGKSLLKKSGHSVQRCVGLKHNDELPILLTANLRLCMGSRRGFIIRMRLGDVAVDPMSSPSHPVRARLRSTLGPSSDGRQYAVVHVTGYIRNWPPTSEFLSGVREHLASPWLYTVVQEWMASILEKLKSAVSQQQFDQ